MLASVLIRRYAVSRQRKNETDGGITKKPHRVAKGLLRQIKTRQDELFLFPFCRASMAEPKGEKTHALLYMVNRRELYCHVELTLSDYPLYGKQFVASRG